MTLFSMMTGLGAAKITISDSGITRNGQSIERGGLFNMDSYLSLDGGNSMKSNLSVGGYSIESVEMLNPANNALNLLGGLDMNNNAITNVDWANSDNPDTNTQLDDQIAESRVNMGSNQIENVGSPDKSSDAATKGYVDSETGGSPELWYYDDDGDGYAAKSPDAVSTQGSDPGAPWEKLGDCKPNEAGVNPDASWVSSQVGGTWDVNCDNTVEKRWTDTGGNSQCDYSEGDTGWSGSSVPSCGETADWHRKWNTGGCTLRTQECR